MRKAEKRPGWQMLLYCLLVAVCFLTICSKSSFLYPLNNGSDTQCFFTVGKGMMHGMVPYRDLVEQKGPLLYFLYGLAALVSERSFFGVYLLEILSYTAFLYCSYQIFALFFPSKMAKFYYIAAPLMAMVSFTSPSFFHGGEVEELTLPLMALTLYFLLRYCRELYPAAMPLSWLFLAGVCAGCVLWMKFTLLGFWIGFMAVVFIGLLFSRQPARALGSCLMFLGGMAVTALPWLAYFGREGALKDLFHVYFYNNIFAYAEELSMGERLTSILESLARMAYRTPWLFGAAVIAVAGVLILRRLHQNWLGAVAPLVCALGLAAGLYWGGRRYTYYFFIFAGFTVLAAVVITHLIVAVGSRWFHPRSALPGRRLMALSAVLAVVLSGVSYFFCENTYLLGTPKAQCVQYRFASIINEQENATLLSYNFLDFGFYYAADILPVSRYFCLLNIDDAKLPEMRAELNRIVRERGVDFVIVMLSPEQDAAQLYLPELTRNYELAAQQVETTDNRIQLKFALFRAKDLAPAP